MPIYEYRCHECKKRFEFLRLTADDPTEPTCTHCGSVNVRKLISRVRVKLSDESRFERLADPSNFGGLDEKDPKSLARWLKRMGKEAGEDVGDDEIEEMVEKATSKNDSEEI
jgi:putative FmdB family regulatory protein